MTRHNPLVGVVVAGALAGATSLPAQASGSDEQLWTEFDVVAPVTANTSITVSSQLRLSEELSNPTLTSLAADFGYKLGSWTLALGYLHQVTGNRDESPNVTQLARGTATWSRKFGRGTLLVRGRLQDTLTADSNPWQARLRVEYRWATENLGAVSYLYTNDEVFYQFFDQSFFRNRFQAGVNLNFTEQFSARVYYQYQDTDNNTPKVINALGIVAVYAFK